MMTEILRSSAMGAHAVGDRDGDLDDGAAAGAAVEAEGGAQARGALAQADQAEVSRLGGHHCLRIEAPAVVGRVERTALIIIATADISCKSVSCSSRATRVRSAAAASASARTRTRRLRWNQKPSDSTPAATRA